MTKNIEGLSAAIMNLPCVPKWKLNEVMTFAMAYKLGHRDARHAAAELASEAAALLEAAPAAQGGEARQIEDCPELNLSNYTPDDVDWLNDWACRADAELDRLCPAAQPAAPTVAEATELLISALSESKGWLKGYARAIIEDAIERKAAPSIDAWLKEVERLIFVVEGAAYTHGKGATDIAPDRARTVARRELLAHLRNIPSACAGQCAAQADAAPVAQEPVAYMAAIDAALQRRAPSKPPRRGNMDPNDCPHAAAPPQAAPDLRESHKELMQVLEWALLRIRTSLDRGDKYDHAEDALTRAKGVQP